MIKKLPSPQQIKKAIEAAGILNESLYNAAGHNEIFPYSEAKTISSSVSPAKELAYLKKIEPPKPKPAPTDNDILMYQLMQQTDVNLFKKLLGKNKLIHIKQNMIIDVVTITPSKMNKDQKLLWFNVHGNGSVFMSVMMNSLKANFKIK